MDEVLRYVVLTMIQGFGVVSQNRLITLCKDISACFEMPFNELLGLDNRSPALCRIGRKRLEDFVHYREDNELIQRAGEVISQAAGKGISIITAADYRYPERFAGLPDMPVVLYAAGELKINEYACSAGIVGARRCSREGKQKAIETAESEIKKGSAIISGMAKGIDSYAHTAALKSNGYTIAVLGSGPDICYPKEHERLYSELISHGCVLSEYPPGTPPRAYMFPKRNRLIAALSDEVYVIDAGRHSGTGSTVEDCKRYGRSCVGEGMKAV